MTTIFILKGETLTLQARFADSHLYQPMKISVSSGITAAAILGCWASISGIAAAASAVQSFSAATNNRYANNTAFVGSAFDFSGVGRDGSGRWGTMLSPTVFIGANHFAPSGALIFYPGNNPLATPVTISISTGQQLGGSDLYIGRLASPVPSFITSYSYLGIPLTGAGFGSSGVANLPVFMGGISVSGNAYGSAVTNQVIGTNRIEGFIKNAVAMEISGTSDVVYTVTNQPGDSVFGYSPTTYETQLSGGDSGSPLLVRSGASLFVAGTAFGVGSGDIDPGASVANRDLTAYTYTGNYASLIQNYISVSVVPEPAVSIFPLIFAFAMIHRERRRNRTCKISGDFP